MQRGHFIYFIYEFKLKDIGLKKTEVQAESHRENRLRLNK